MTEKKENRWQVVYVSSERLKEIEAQLMANLASVDWANEPPARNPANVPDDDVELPDAPLGTLVEFHTRVPKKARESKTGWKRVNER